jgi:hypothetical protein
MADLADRVRTRVIPAILTALGVTMLAVGLLSYTTPVDAGPLASDRPTPGVGQVSPSPLLTLPPIGSGAPATASPSFPADRVATRVRIAALKIDLAVVKPPPGANTYPLCDVAMYLQDKQGALGQPGEGKATYLYAHARDGMFLPILTASKISNGKKMLGMVVEVYTSDDQRFLYEIIEVRRHQLDLNDAVTATSEELWLQTSEGPKGTPGKTQVVASFLSQAAADHADAHPTAKPVVCG